MNKVIKKVNSKYTNLTKKILKILQKNFNKNYNDISKKIKTWDEILLNNRINFYMNKAKKNKLKNS